MKEKVVLTLSRFTLRNGLLHWAERRDYPKQRYPKNDKWVSMRSELDKTNDPHEEIKRLSRVAKRKYQLEAQKCAQNNQDTISRAKCKDKKINLLRDWIEKEYSHLFSTYKDNVPLTYHTYERSETKAQKVREKSFSSFVVGYLRRNDNYTLRRLRKKVDDLGLGAEILTVL